MVRDVGVRVLARVSELGVRCALRWEQRNFMRVRTALLVQQRLSNARQSLMDDGFVVANLSRDERHWAVHGPEAPLRLHVVERLLQSRKHILEQFVRRDALADLCRVFVSLIRQIPAGPRRRIAKPIIIETHLDCFHQEPATDAKRRWPWTTTQNKVSHMDH